MMRAIKELDLSDAQRSQIQQLVQQYRQQYPKGSTPDPQARKALREKIFATLTPDQQTQLKQRLAQMRAQRGAQDGESNGAPAGPAAPAAPAPAPSPNAR
jgi:Spy/CpxP family protein refolding chaperone